MRLLGTFASRRIAVARAQLWADELQDSIRVEMPRDRLQPTRVWACERKVWVVIGHQEPPLR